MTKESIFVLTRQSFYIILFLFLADHTCFSQTQKIMIDPSQTYGGSAKQMFDSIRYIPLETNRKSVFGNVDKLTVIDSCFVILDRQTNGVYIFSREGKFLGIISGEDRRIENFSVDAKEGRIAVVFFDQQALMGSIAKMPGLKKEPFALYEAMRKYTRIAFYDFSGKNVSGDQNDIKLSLFGNLEFPLDSHFKMVWDLDANTAFPDMNIHTLSIYEKDKEVATYFPLNIRKDIATASNLRGRRGDISISRSEKDTTVYFTRPYDNTVYEISPRMIREKFRFIFPLQNSLDRSFFADSLTDVQRIEFITAHQNVITAIPIFFQSGQILFFRLYSANRNSSFTSDIIYSIKSQKAYGLYKIRTDSTSYFLPLYDRYHSLGLSAFYKDCFFSSVSSLEMFDTKVQNEEKNINYPEGLRSYFSSQSKKSNPVIIEILPKKNL